MCLRLQAPVTILKSEVLADPLRRLCATKVLVHMISLTPTGDPRRTARPCPQPAFGAVFKYDVAAVAAHDAARDGTPEAASSGIAAARCFEPHEGLKHPSQVGRRYPRPFVLDDDMDLGIVLFDARRRPLPVDGRVLQQVAQRPAQRRRPAGGEYPSRVRNRDVMPELREIGSNAVNAPTTAATSAQPRLSSIAQRTSVSVLARTRTSACSSKPTIANAGP